MGRGAKRKVDKRGPLQRALDNEAAANDRAPLVSDHAAKHGDYERGVGRQMINRGGTPLARWRKAGFISESENRVIDLCLTLWSRIGTSGGMVANLDRTVFGCPGEGHAGEVDARNSLQRFREHVGPAYWSIFENVIRFDEPAGIAGSRLSGPSSKNEDRARHCVLMVANIVAYKERLA